MIKIIDLLALGNIHFRIITNFCHQKVNSLLQIVLKPLQLQLITSDITYVVYINPEHIEIKNSPRFVLTEGIGETILDGIEKLGAKLSETAADRQAALLAKLDLGSSTSNYQPPVVCDSTVHTFHSQTEDSSTHLSKTDIKSSKC